MNDDQKMRGWSLGRAFWDGFLRGLLSVGTIFGSNSRFGINSPKVYEKPLSPKEAAKRDMLAFRSDQEKIGGDFCRVLGDFRDVSEKEKERMKNVIPFKKS